MPQIVWIIGASSGIGLELARLFLQAKHRVIISARDTKNSAALAKLKEEFTLTAHLVDLDVRNTQSTAEAFKLASGLYGGIDLCIYNAGVYESMQIDTWDIEHFEAMNQVNYMGAVRILTQIVPLFVEQKRGHIVFNASISSYFGLPYGGGYSAPKAALLNFCESIEPELAQKDIKLQIINHGFVKTRLTAKNDFEMPQLLEPLEAAQKIYEGIGHPEHFEIKFPKKLGYFLQLLRILPYKLSLSLTKRMLK